MLEKSASLREAATAFVDYKVRRNGSTRATAITYTSNLADFLTWSEGTRVSDLTLDMIDCYIDTVAQKDYKPKTFKNKVVIIRSLVRFLYAKNLTDIRPESIELPKIVETEANFLDDDEQRSLIDCIDNVRDRAIILTMLRSGVRVSELINLRTTDLFERSLIVRCGKGKKPRVTFINEEAERAIADYQKTKKHTEYLFTNYLGDKLSRQYVHRLVTIYGAKANTTKTISPHTLRHTFATNMLRKGARVEDVRPMMGHANISTTLLYMHFTNDFLHQRYDDVMEKVAKI